MMFYRRLATALLTLHCYSAVFAQEVSLMRSDWHLLSYQGIPVHELTDTLDGLKLSIKKSASPVVTAFPSPVPAKEIRVKAKINGTLDLSGVSQGQSGADDFRLRIGLVYAGGQALDPFQRSLAPGWVKRLSVLLPAGTGISHVQFLNSYMDAELANMHRVHPTTALWREQFVLQVDQSGNIDQRILLEDDSPILGVWISADGDDTGSCFDVILQNISFE